MPSDISAAPDADPDNLLADVETPILVTLNLAREQNGNSLNNAQGQNLTKYESVELTSS